MQSARGLRRYVLPGLLITTILPFCDIIYNLFLVFARQKRSRRRYLAFDAGSLDTGASDPAGSQMSNDEGRRVIRRDNSNCQHGLASCAWRD